MTCANADAVFVDGSLVVESGASVEIIGGASLDDLFVFANNMRILDKANVVIRADTCDEMASLFVDETLEIGKGAVVEVVGGAAARAIQAESIDIQAESTVRAAASGENGIGMYTTALAIGPDAKIWVDTLPNGIAILSYYEPGSLVIDKTASITAVSFLFNRKLYVQPACHIQVFRG